MKMRVLLGGAFVLVAFALVAGAQDDKTPTIKQVMTKLHKGANSPFAKLKGQLKEASPPWAEIQKESDQFVNLGAALEKNDPPKGDKDSWQKLAASFLKDGKDLDEAAKAEDKAKADAAFKRLGASCKGCHTAHKGK